MKITRTDRQSAKQLFQLCHINGQLDEAKVRGTVDVLAKQKPRRYLAILEHLKRLIGVELEKRTLQVTSAQPLPADGAELFLALEQKLGRPLATRYEVKPELLGGVRIQYGSDVWDGTVAGRLQKLRQALAN